MDDETPTGPNAPHPNEEDASWFEPEGGVATEDLGLDIDAPTEPAEEDEDPTPAADIDLGPDGLEVEAADGEPIVLPDGVIPGETPGWPADGEGRPFRMDDEQRAAVAASKLAKNGDGQETATAEGQAGPDAEIHEGIGAEEIEQLEAVVADGGTLVAETETETAEPEAEPEPIDVAPAPEPKPESGVVDRNREYVVLQQHTLTEEMCDALLQQVRAGKTVEVLTIVGRVMARTKSEAYSKTWSKFRQNFGTEALLSAIPDKSWAVKHVKPRVRTVEEVEID